MINDIEIPENDEELINVCNIINVYPIDNSKSDKVIVPIKELKCVIDKIIEKIKPENKIQVYTTKKKNL